MVMETSQPTGQTINRTPPSKGSKRHKSHFRIHKTEVDSKKVNTMIFARLKMQTSLMRLPEGFGKQQKRKPKALKPPEFNAMECFLA